MKNRMSMPASHVPSAKQSRAGNSKSIGCQQIKRYHDDFWAEERKRQKIQLKLEDGYLLIKLPLIIPPHRSRSGKSDLVATTGGVKRTPLLIEGVPVHINATATIYRDWQPPVRWVPLIELPKSEVEEEDEADQAEWDKVPLLE